ncbi:MAG TPA: hypothetical protein VGE74_22765 [Gemmata sp.]
MIANGQPVPRERITVDETGATVELPAPATTLRLSRRFLHDLRAAIECAALAGAEGTGPPAALFSTAAQEGD